LFSVFLFLFIFWTVMIHRW